MGRREIPYESTMETENNKPAIENQKQKPPHLFAVSGCAQLNLRAKPTVEADVVTVLSEGTRLVGSIENDDWSLVETTTGSIQKGYAMRKYLVEV